MIRRRALFITLLVSLATPALAQNIDGPAGYEQLIKLPVPVVEGDITDRPYRVVGHIDKGVRKATIFSKSASREKVFRELWEDAQKLGADAVIQAQYGESRITGLSWGSREARGLAVKFLTDEEIALRAADEAARNAGDAAEGAATIMRSEAAETHDHSEAVPAYESE